MSFYGNQYLEFKDFFYKLLLKKNGAESAEIEVVPDAMHDVLTVEGDAWITIDPHKEGDKNDGLIITHTESALGEGTTLDTLTNIQKEQAEGKDVDLIHAGYLKANQITVDSRGHITKVQPLYYQLPDVSDLEGRVSEIEGRITWKNLSDLIKSE